MNDLITWYGLKCYPFDKEIKTKDTIDTAPLTECMARLIYMKRRGGLMLLTGDPGIGKTIAMRRFVAELNENLYRPLYTPLSTLNRLDLLRHIGSLLGLPNRAAKSALYTQIQKEFINSKEKNGRTVVLILDESQLLKVGPFEELRLLTNFKMDSFEPFIIIISGQSELRRTMSFSIMEPLTQRLAMRYHMPPLSPEETATYIKHHLKLARADESIFSNDAIQAIHEISFGIPRRIGNAATRSMTYAMFDGKRNVDADTVLKNKDAE